MQNYTFTNWSGSVKSSPQSIEKPSSESEIISLIEKASTEGKTIRPVGSGHSFTPLVQTNDIIVSLDNWQGLISVDKENYTATAKSGTKIHQFSDLAFSHGLAQENLGDIDQQSIAGALSTGTHGTGISFGTLSTQLTEIKLINGKGEFIVCSESNNREIFKAAQIGLGSLGIITEMSFRLVPAYKLKYVGQKENVFDVLQNFERHNAQNRNFEFYWFPYSEVAQTKYSNITDEPVDTDKLSYFMDLLVENWLYEALCFPTRYFPSLSKSVAKISSSLLSGSKKVNYSHKVYATPRTVRFNEMEISVPIQAFKEVKTEVIRTFQKRKFNVQFPTENRFVKQDDIWMSSAYGRDSAYIAFHVYRGKEYLEYFKTMCDICSHYEGRPHWGKMHQFDTSYLSKNIPKWDDFMKLRAEMDPKGVFLSPYMKKLFGV